MTKNKKNLYAILYADRKNLSSISDVFGSYRISDQGEITFNIKGMLLKDFPTYFLIYSDD